MAADVVAFKKNPDGSFTFSNGVEERTELSPAIQAQVAAVESSRASRLLARARSGTLPPEARRYERVELPMEDGGTEEVWIKRLQWDECVRVHMESSHSGNGALNILENSEDMAALANSILATCIFEDEEGLRNLFTLESAAELIKSLDPGHQTLQESLVNEAMLLSPLLVPKQVRERQMPVRALAESAT